MSEEAQDLINKLLAKNMDDRLGASGDFEEIVEHKWFSDIDMDLILKKEIEPPFKPDLPDGKYDVSHFDPNVTCLDARESE